MISPVQIYKIIQQFVAPLSSAMSGRNLKGIRNRTVFAVGITMIGIGIDTFFVFTHYDYLPSLIGTGYGWDYTASSVESKSVFWNYEVQRLVLLLIFAAVGWLIHRSDRTSITRFRTFQFLVETANLIILTGIGISVVMLYLSLGDEGKKLSETWDCVVMLVWFGILLVEYVFDLKFLRKEKTPTQTRDRM